MWLAVRLLIAHGATVQRLREIVIPPVEAGEESSGMMGTVACPHPSDALSWESVRVGGPDGERPMIVVRCDRCGRALSVFPDG